MAGRLVKLLKLTGITQGTVLLTGGLAPTPGCSRRCRRSSRTRRCTVEAVSHPDAIYAGAIGAALWGAFRHEKLRELEERRAA